MEEDKQADDCNEALAYLMAWRGRFCEVWEAHHAVQDHESHNDVESFHSISKFCVEWLAPLYNNQDGCIQHKLDSYLSPEELLPIDEHKS